MFTSFTLAEIIKVSVGCTEQVVSLFNLIRLNPIWF